METASAGVSADEGSDDYDFEKTPRLDTDSESEEDSLSSSSEHLNAEGDRTYFHVWTDMLTCPEMHSLDDTEKQEGVDCDEEGADVSDRFKSPLHIDASLPCPLLQFGPIPKGFGKANKEAEGDRGAAEHGQHDGEERCCDFRRVAEKNRRRHKLLEKQRRLEARRLIRTQNANNNSAAGEEMAEVSQHLLSSLAEDSTAVTQSCTLGRKVRSQEEIERALLDTMRKTNQVHSYELKGGHRVEIRTAVSCPNPDVREVSVAVTAVHRNQDHQVALLKNMRARKRPDLGLKVKDCLVKIDHLAMTREGSTWNKTVVLSYDSTFRMGGDRENKTNAFSFTA